MTKTLNDLEHGTPHEQIAYFILEWACFGGSDHKQWVLDRVLRDLVGEDYEALIEEYCEGGEYSWDVGIAP